METGTLAILLIAAASIPLTMRLHSRWILSRAKHQSLAGHSRMARFLAKRMPFYEYDDEQFFESDGADEELADRRRQAFERLESRLRQRSPRSRQLTAELRDVVSDLQFTSAYRVPFQYRNIVRKRLTVGAVLDASAGPKLRDADGNWSFDLSGSYGVNVFGYDFYKECVDEGIRRTRELGPVLGALHPVVIDNVRRLRSISGLDEVSFHMSGTEAVMQAVRLARFNTGRTHLVRFCGSYHGWWDGVQPGIGSERSANDVYTLRDMDGASLRVLKDRRDIACVLINPVQALHPNQNAPGDAMLIDSGRNARFDRQAYTNWLRELRDVCARKKIALIFDEVFVGFRLACGGAQEYFDVRADMVTYGKTLGGGLPVGVVCGKRHLMKRFHEDRPSHICFARGTFNSHPYVMGAMNAFLQRIDTDEVRRRYAVMDEVWNQRADCLNRRLDEEGLPVGIAHFNSIWTVVYKRPGRYNWLFQFYLRAEGCVLSWVGTGRFIFGHDLGDADFEAILEKFVAAARAMASDGWWEQPDGLSNRAIRKQILCETLLRVAGRKPVTASREDSPAVETCGR